MAGQAPRWDQAPPQGLASASQAVEAQECPAAAYRGRGCQTWCFYPAIACLEAEHRARHPVKALHVRKECHRPGQDQAPEARALASAARGRLVSDLRALMFRPSRTPCRVTPREARTLAAVPASHGNPLQPRLSQAGGRDVAISSRFYIFEESGALKRVPRRIHGALSSEKIPFLSMQTLASGSLRSSLRMRAASPSASWMHKAITGSSISRVASTKIVHRRPAGTLMTIGQLIL